MAGVTLICGRICSGKTRYARALLAQRPAVLLSTDEATFDLIENEQGEFYNIFAARVNRYLEKKAVEICRAGADVILDWGFWTRGEREGISRRLRDAGIDYRWHYVDVSDEQWQRNIAERNARILRGEGGSDFYVDDGLMRKLLGLFEVPSPEEMDVWHTVRY